MSGSLAKTLRLSACVLSLSLTAACGDACRTLAAQICVCLPDDGSRAACNERAKLAEATFSVRPEDEKFCQQQIDSHACDCNKLSTPEGKVGCGLAYIAP